MFLFFIFFVIPLPTMSHCILALNRKKINLINIPFSMYFIFVIQLLQTIRRFISVYYTSADKRTIMALDFAATYKVLVLGDSNVGKTCIVHRFCDERYYDTYISTIGMLLELSKWTLDIDCVRRLSQLFFLQFIWHSFFFFKKRYRFQAKAHQFRWCTNQVANMVRFNLNMRLIRGNSIFSAKN